jgi:hypothetical protein
MSGAGGAGDGPGREREKQKQTKSKTKTKANLKKTRQKKEIGNQSEQYEGGATIHVCARAY